MRSQQRRLALLAKVLLDIALINLAFGLAYWMRYDRQWIRPVDEANDVPYNAFLPISLALTAILLWAFKMSGVYERRRGQSWFDEVYRLLSGTATGIVTMMVLYFLSPSRFYSRLIFLYAAVLIVFFLGLARLGERELRRYRRRQGLGMERVLIVGAGEAGRTVMRHIIAQPSMGYQVVGFVDDDPQAGHADIGPLKALGPVQNLPRLVRELAVDEVVIALEWTSHRKIMEVVAQCEREQVPYRIVPDLFQLSLTRVDIDEISGIPAIGVKEAPLRGWNLTMKRAIDVAVALLGLVLLSPLLFLVALFIKLFSPGPVLFAQERLGRNGRPFTIYKFRSMKPGAEKEQEELARQSEAAGPIFKMRDDPRFTRLGRFLRRTSLDELPQLYNVLGGDMSLVGPRPPTMGEYAHYEDWHRRRLEAHPGMTGLWQVSGRSDLSFEEMVLLDIYYIENWSLGLDFRILLRTIPAVILGNGAY